MANRAGLKKVTKSVHGKKGTVRRSYWIKAKEGAKSVGGKVAGAARSAGNFLNKHKGKIAAGVGLAAAGYGAYKGHQLFKAGGALGLSRGATLKAAASVLKDRAKGAAERGAHAVVGVGAKAHKAASSAASAVSTKVKQGIHRASASRSEMSPSAGDRAKGAIGRAGQRVKSAAASVKSTFEKYARHSKRGKSRGRNALPSGS